MIRSKRLFNFLIFANIVQVILLWYFTRNTFGADCPTYNGLAEGILHGRYSFWWFLPQYFPDTFRNPGYPLFLAFLKLIHNSFFTVRLVQILLYVASVAMTLKIMHHYNKAILFKNIFLLLLLVNVNMPGYINLIGPEILMLFLLTLSFYIDIFIKEKYWFKYILLGLIYGFIFQVRPVYLFFPFIKFVVEWYWKRKNFPLFKNILVLVLFILTTIPYAVWNQRHHGVFSITSLEGGGGVLFLGYWAPKIPGYFVTKPWFNKMSNEIISESDTTVIQQNIRLYNDDWHYIDSIVDPMLTHKDSIMSTSYLDHPELFHTYNAKYTLEREKLFKQLTVDHYRKDIPYAIKTRVITFFRLWYTNFDAASFYKYTSMGLCASMYVFAITFGTMLLALIFIPVAFFRNYRMMHKLSLFVILLLYFGMIHTPFAIQSRYTIPVRMILLMVIAFSIGVTLFNKEIKENEVG